jgi:hypothetical protein
MRASTRLTLGGLFLLCQSRIRNDSASAKPAGSKHSPSRVWTCRATWRWLVFADSMQIACGYFDARFDLAGLGWPFSPVSVVDPQRFRFSKACRVEAFSKSHLDVSCNLAKTGLASPRLEQFGDEARPACLM